MRPLGGTTGRPLQGRLAVVECGPDGLLAAARVCHDVEAPVNRS